MAADSTAWQQVVRKLKKELERERLSANSDRVQRQQVS